MEMSNLNRGDTCNLILNCKLNGETMTEGMCKEIEVQINKQSVRRNVKKLLSKGEIYWGTFTWEDEQEVEHTFVGYGCHLSQEETFKLSQGANEVQVRVLDNYGEVGSCKITMFVLGEVLSSEVLKNGDNS